MSCEYCTDPDGLPCFPMYGLGPHTHKPTGSLALDGLLFIGSTVPLPEDQWPDNYREDPECPGLGTYWCPHCGEGKPDDIEGAPAND